MIEFLKEKLGAEKGAEIARLSEKQYQKLCGDLSSYSKSKQKVLKNTILPRIALYKTLLNQGVERDKALQIMDEHMVIFSATPMHKTYKKIDRLPFGWTFFKVGFTHIVSHSDLWDAKVSTEKGKFSVIMHKCFWKDTFDRYKCPEMCQFACRCDDLTYGNLEHIGYTRTQTLGTGGYCCDFQFYQK